MFTRNSGKAKMLKGLGQRLDQFAKVPYKLLQRKSFLINASRDQLQWGKFHGLSKSVGCMEKFSSR